MLIDDNSGNTISKSDGTSVTGYVYDYENRLTTINSSPFTINYTYDPFGKRLSKTVGGVTTYYLYDDEDIIAEYDATGTPTATYIHGQGIDEPVSMTRGGSTYYYTFDGLGSVKDLTDSTETLVEQYDYDSFGNLTTPPATGNPYTYTAREYDPETGLLFYRARYYDPKAGRFITEDPIGFWGGDVNFYAYVAGNPINWIDPYGLSCAPWDVWSDFVAPDFNDPTSFGANFWNSVYQDRSWERISIDAGGTLAAPGKLKPALKGGLRLSAKGLDAYYGFGLGSGKGASITVNYSSAAIDPIFVGASAKGGTGIYGYSASISTSSSGSNISGGFGWGIGNGFSVGSTHRIRLIGF